MGSARGKGKPIRILVRTLAGECWHCDCHANDSLASVKTKIPLPSTPDFDPQTNAHFVTHVPANFTLADLDIKDGDSVYVATCTNEVLSFIFDYRRTSELGVREILASTTD